MKKPVDPPASQDTTADTAASDATRDTPTRPDRRRFMTGIATTGAGVIATGLAGIETARSEVLFPPGGGFGPGAGAFGGGGSAGGGVYRSENNLYDCEVEGKLPADLDGAFYRIGPDPQYPKPAKYVHDIAFDGEGHISMFRIKDGHVDYRSRYVQTQRWKAQHAARKSLFGMYRNPTTDDPSVKGVSRGTANTQIFYHHGKLMAMKEDSPPVLLNPHTLDTTDDYHTFDGALEGQTFTAHPKIDSETGELVAFGYEAKGLATDDVFVFSLDKSGKRNWSTWIKVPYAGMIHDFGVTQKHVLFYVVPLATNMDVIKSGGPHFAWDSTLPTYFGVLRRGGDGKDLRWFKGPSYFATHTMGNWDDGNKIYWDMDGGQANQFPFFPQVHEKFDPQKAQGHIMRMSVDLSRKKVHDYTHEWMYPDVSGALSRQDDRYHTVHYRYGFINTMAPGGGWVVVDQQTKTTRKFVLGPDISLAEACFVPRRKGAAEADGYLMGVATYHKQGNRNALVIADIDHLEDGPIALVQLPYRIVGQIHGFWVPGTDLPPIST
jgi:carotenoid cleavage dioxygenase-like enzyme